MASGPVLAQERSHGSASRAVPSAGLPYAASTAVGGVSWDYGSLRLLAPGSDNWPVTMSAGGRLLASYGDGGGFGAGAAGRAYVSLGVAELTGSDAASLSGKNLIGGLSPSVGRCFPWAPPGLRETRANGPCRGEGLAGKSTGILALGDQLYMWITPGSNAQAYREARLYRSRIGSNTWAKASWAFTRADGVQLVKPTFLQAGADAADTGDGYVYSYAAGYAPVDASKLSVQLGPRGGEAFLLRAPRTADLLAETSWEFFGGATPSGEPTWVADVRRAEPVITDRNGMGVRVSAAYVKELDRYFLMAEHTNNLSGYFGMFEAENAWGPWRVVYYDRLTGHGIPDDTAFFYNFLPGSFSADGRSFTLVFTGIGKLDALAVMDGTFQAPGDDARKNARRKSRSSQQAATATSGRTSSVVAIPDGTLSLDGTATTGSASGATSASAARFVSGGSDGSTVRRDRRGPLYSPIDILSDRPDLLPPEGGGR